MKFFTLILIAFVSSGIVKGQSTILDEYVEYGIQNNLALKQLNYNYEESLYALKEARSYFYPNVSINARMTVADGGRKIDFPVGDLLNPVYSTLNDLTASEQFPQINNEEIAFMRPFEQDTRVSLVQPVFNPGIYYNSKIRKELTNSAAIDNNIYQRNLVADIKTAYMNHLKANKWIELLNESEILIKENIRVNKSLYENDKVTIDYIYRSEAELSKLEQQLAEAERNLDVSRKYFNFLINKTLNSEVIIDIDLGKSLPNFPELEDINETASSRSEIQLIESYSQANLFSQKLYSANYLPTLAVAADYGFQGDKYTFNQNADFAMLSVAFQWNLFSGMQRKAKLQQARIQGLSLAEKQHEIQSQIELQINAAFLDLVSSGKAIEAANKQQHSAEQSFKIINKKYIAGQLNLLEYLDAQTTLTNSRENYWLEVYNYYIKLATYEREIEPAGEAS